MSLITTFFKTKKTFLITILAPHSEPVKDALRHAYPDAEKDNPFETIHQLHKFLEIEPLDYWGGHDVENLIKMYPEAVRKRGRDGRLPLHIAIDRIAHDVMHRALSCSLPMAHVLLFLMHSSLSAVTTCIDFTAAAAAAASSAALPQLERN